MAKMTLREYANAWLKSKGTTATAAKKNAGKYKSIAAAKKAGSLYYTDKNGKVMLAVYAEDLKGPKPGGRDSSPRPKLRPTTKDKPKPDPKRVAAENKKSETGDKSAVASGGKTVAAIKKTAEKALSRAEQAEAEYEKNREASKKRRGPDPGQKFNAWYKENGKNYSTMKEAMEAYQATLKMSKGGMAKKRGYSSGGSVAKPRTGHIDRRSKGLFN